jgi:4-cresol dehydrogenase (hydroxylating)
MTCYRELLNRMTEAGFYSYRLGIQAQQLFDPKTAYGGLLATLKDALDPHHILAPGRYLAPVESLQTTGEVLKKFAAAR